MPIRWKVTDVIRSSCVMYNDPFSTNYPENTIVTAKPDTLGIFVFDTKKNAKAFVKKMPGWLILKVKSIGKGNKPEFIAGSCSARGLKEFYDNRESAGTYVMPLGTICYPAVEVLE